MSQATPPSTSSRSRAQEARQLRHRSVQPLSTATCTWSDQHAALFFSFEIPSLHSAFSFYLQGIRQHNPAAYVLNKTGPKHRPPAGPASVSSSKSDSVDSTGPEPVTVRFTHLPNYNFCLLLLWVSLFFFLLIFECLCLYQVAAATANMQKSHYPLTALKTSKSLGKTAKALEAQEVLKKKQVGFIFYASGCQIVG